MVRLIGREQHRMSMAASAPYIPGLSLADKLRLEASKGQLDMVHQMIDAGADFGPDREGRTALHYAALNGHSEIVQVLADEAADIDAQDNLGYTALHRAAAQGHLEVIKVLLVEGCLVDRQDQVHGNSPLHEAAWNGYSKTLELLVRHKANVHCINRAGFTALHLAAQNGHNQSARVLLYAGCNPDMKNNYGDTALHTAARYGHAGVTRILISARCNISEQNKNGDTGLHIAAALKRRKLSKLFVESGINTSLKNKQNETAVDVARRKDHPEIILIINSAPITKNGKKSKKKEKKDKKEKGSKQLLSSEEEPEKRGLFWKKSKKSTDADKQKVVDVNAKPPDFRPREFPPQAPSEISSSEFNSQMAPEELPHGFRHHHRAPGKEGTLGRSHRGTRTQGQSKVRGVLNEYAPKTGVQYYKDLAGNVRQGPIGYAPVCNCQPEFKKIEKRMEVDRNNIYDHIDASHKNLAERIDSLDKRTVQQVQAIDKTTRERFKEDAKNREEFVHSCIRKDRMEMQEDCEHRHDTMKRDLHGYLDNRFTNFERYYAITAAHREPRFPCRDDEYKPRCHDDDMVNMVYDPEEPPMPGRLYKSKSDETLSVASSHPSRRHWKFRSNMQRDLTDLKLARVHDQAKRLERKICLKSAGVSVKVPLTEHVHRDSVPVHRHSRMPEGNSGSELHSEYQSYKGYVDRQHQWNAKRNPVDVGMAQNLDKPQPEIVNNYGSLRRGTRTQQNGYYPPVGGNSQQVKVEVHQTRPPVTSQMQPPPVVNGHHLQNNGSTDLHGNETPRGRATGETTRSRSSSSVRDGSQQARPSQRPPSLSELRQSHSAYNMGGNPQQANRIPQSTSYESSISQHQQQANRYPPHAFSQPAPGQGSHPAPVPPVRSSSVTRNTHHPPPATSPNSAPPQWTPLHTSSPDAPITCNSPSDSLLSGQKNSPLYPSPNPPQMTRSESSSNPDSGYGSRLFGGRQVSGTQLPGSHSSSFQSHEHNSSLSTNHSSVNGGSPIVQYHQEPMTRRPVSAGQNNNNDQKYPPQQEYSQQPSHVSVPAIVNRWYDSKRQDTNQQAAESNRMWPPARSSRPVQGQQNDQPRYDSGAIIGKATQV